MRSTYRPTAAASASTTTTSKTQLTKKQAEKEWGRIGEIEARFLNSLPSAALTQETLAEYLTGQIRVSDLQTREFAVGNWPTDVRPVVARAIRDISAAPAFDFCVFCAGVNRHIFA